MCCQAPVSRKHVDGSLVPENSENGDARQRSVSLLITIVGNSDK